MSLVHRCRNYSCIAKDGLFFDKGKLEKLCRYRHQYANNGQEFTGEEAQDKAAQTGCMPSNNSSLIQRFEYNIEVVFHAGMNREDGKLERKVFFVLSKF